MIKKKSLHLKVTSGLCGLVIHYHSLIFTVSFKSITQHLQLYPNCNENQDDCKDGNFPTFQLLILPPHNAVFY